MKRPTNILEITNIVTEAFEAARLAELEYVEQYGEPMYCGFAWVNMPANTKFAKVLQGLGYATKSYSTGIDVWNPGRSATQSLDVKECGARAFVNVLNKYNLKANVQSRAD